MKAVGYIRVSTDKAEQADSIKNQKNQIENFVKSNGYTLEKNYVDIESGTTAKRKELIKMLQDLENDKFEVIITKELSRLARNGELSYKIRNLCSKKDIHIITLDDTINTVKENENLFGLFSWVYEQESKNTSRRIKLSLNSKYKKGTIFSSPGY